MSHEQLNPWISFDEKEAVFDKMKEECGIFGVYNHPEANHLSYYGLHALQHRGQESAGICTSDGKKFHFRRGMGLVKEAFDNEELNQLEGHMAIGHVRYSTSGESHLQNAQPLIFRFSGGELAIATNGNLTNALQLRKHLERQGSIFQTTSDTEVIAHLIARSGYENIEDGLKDALSMIKGAYALLIMTNEKIIAALDPNGFRPFSIGRLGEAYLFASETCAFDAVGGDYWREVQPGEMIVINQDGFQANDLLTQRAARFVPWNTFISPDRTATSTELTCTVLENV